MTVKFFLRLIAHAPFLVIPFDHCLHPVQDNYIAPSALVLGRDPDAQWPKPADRWANELATMHNYDYVITTVQSISPSREQPVKLAAMAAKSHAMCVAGTGPLFDLIICDEAHHAIATTWNLVFQSLGPVAPTLITRGNGHRLRPKQLLLTGTSHRLMEQRFPVEPRHNLRIWTLSQGFRGLEGLPPDVAEEPRQRVLLKRTVFYEVSLHVSAVLIA